TASASCAPPPSAPPPWAATPRRGARRRGRRVRPRPGRDDLREDGAGRRQPSTRPPPDPAGPPRQRRLEVALENGRRGEWATTLLRPGSHELRVAVPVRNRSGGPACSN